jgi:ubiquinone/menaquinone biosynthesis C-methylase UbiE
VNAYSLFWCDYCGLGRIAGDFSPADIAGFFDIPYYYTHANSEKPQLTLPQKLAWRFDNGVDFSSSELGSARTVCDIGCGDGTLLRRLKEAGLHAIGVEPDPIARKLAMEITKVLDGTAENLPQEISSQQFDAVIMSHVLDICVSIREALKRAKSILHQGGVIVVEVPNFSAKGFQKYGPAWPWTDIPRHLTFFTERSLRKYLEEHDFSMISIKYLGYTRQFSPWWRMAQKEAGRPMSPYLWLAQTALIPAHLKYDSFRIIARA